jgi:hypothetical protein
VSASNFAIAFPRPLIAKPPQSALSRSVCEKSLPT